NHLLIDCVFARDFWFNFLRRASLQVLSPCLDGKLFEDWWEISADSAPAHIRKGLNSLIILGAWTLRTHSNRCVFDGASPSVSRAMVSASEELHLWGLAGARGVNHL
ncbi:hypothetical protein PVAP13_3KG503202, partial [Panicum virgatum]